MATVYTTLANSQNESFTNVSDRPTAGGLNGGRVHIVPCTYTTTGTTAADDVIRLVWLPKGTVVLAGLGFLIQEDPGTGVDFTVGDEITPDADKYSTAITSDSAGKLDFIPGVAGANPVALTEGTWITATIVDGGSISITSGADLTFYIPYILP